MSDLLELIHVTRTFGSLRAVEQVSLSVKAGSRHALIGPNGAGKSTLFNLIGGSLKLSSGYIRFAGANVTGMAEHRRAGLGIARTFQHASLFPHETAVENVLIGVQQQAGAAWSMLRPASRRRALIDRCVALLDSVGLAGRYSRPAAELSHGERRQLELAMALAPRPRLLLLDEPAAGLSPAETAGFIELIASLPADVTILLIEHDLDVVFGLADTVTVLHLGHHLMTGTPAEVQSSAAVASAYLGAADMSDLFPPPAETSGETEPAHDRYAGVASS
ncbi:MAG: ABC transporter ATP-binding protein [Thermomicrobiales bacterium]